MDERPSAIPRLARPAAARPASAVPKPATTLPGPSAVRRAPSGESLAGGLGASWGLQPPKLRRASSRGQLAPSSAGASQATPPRTSTARQTSIRQPRPQPTVAKPQAPQTPRRAHAAGDHAAVARRASSFAAVQLEAPHRGPGADVVGSLPAASSVHTTPAKSSLSLSERTIGTLAQIPSSPAMTKRPSSFFDQARPASTAESGNTRPSSSYSSDSARSSGQDGRLGSGADDDEPTARNLRASSAHFKPSAINSKTKTPQSCAASRRASMAPSSKLAGSSVAARCNAQGPVAGKKLHESSLGKSGIKTAAEKSRAPRTPVEGRSRKPSLPAVASSAENSGSSARPSRQSSAWEGVIPPLAPPSAGSESAEPGQSLSSRKSSAALRQQIAEAKAAKRSAARQASGGPAALSNGPAPLVPSDTGFDFDVGIDNPFNLGRESASSKVLKQRVAAARTSGRLNIAALGLEEMPAEVMKMYDLESIGAHDGSWAESVDLTRLVAADNRLETLDAVFPDVDPDAEDENSQGTMFWGLETIDLHGNVLVGVPPGFLRLAHLTSLNLSSNRLGNDCIDVLSQMTALTDLKLAKNRLSGPLNSALSSLASLELLDLHGNGITALPQNVENLSRLRILNLAENQLSELSFDGLAKMPLVELSLKKNRLSGTLIREPIQSLPLLQIFDASFNQLTCLNETTVCLPYLHTISVSMNRLKELPDMTWPNLVTLAVDENSISSIPSSFTSLGRLRFADFSSNDIRTVPPEIARMGSLLMLRLTGNPLRDKKFASASINEVKQILSQRLEPPPPYQECGDTRPVSDFKAGGARATVEAVEGDSRSEADDDFATPPTSASHSPTRSRGGEATLQ